MAEVLFYHLTLRPLESVLPDLLEKCLARGWRATVQTSSPERCAHLDAHLWTYRDEAFLPHGTSADGPAESQPVFLTAGPENPNDSNVRFLVDRAVPPDLSPYRRAVFLFDGHDPEALAEARAQWTAAKEAGHEITYWQQTEQGGWARKA